MRIEVKLTNSAQQSQDFKIDFSLEVTQDIENSNEVNQTKQAVEVV